MDLKEFGQEIAKIGLPLLGAALPLPGGAAIGTALAAMIGSGSAKPEDLLAAITGDPTKLQAAREFEATNHQHLMQMAYDFETKQRESDSADLAQVNETLRQELTNSASEAWYQKGWRPFNGFSFGVVLFLNYGLPTLINTFAPMIAEKWIPVVSQPVPEFVFVAWGSVLGVTAWHRGVLKRIQVEGDRT
jgi:Holin of 3TMs, for gene-transfer release